VVDVEEMDPCNTDSLGITPEGALDLFNKVLMINRYRRKEVITMLVDPEYAWRHCAQLQKKLRRNRLNFREFRLGDDNE
jgi:hypothetical protein